MHKNCQSMGVKGPCEMGTDAFNLLVDKKVDLILQGHEHDYERSKQLATNATTCPTVPVGSFDADCVVDDGSDGAYTKGAGTVIVIAGTGGHGLRDNNTSDPEAGYFARWMGANNNPTFGVLKVTVSSTQLAAQFVGSTAPSNFTDSFTISGTGAPPTPTLSGTLTPTVTSTLTPIPTLTPTPAPTKTPRPTRTPRP